MRLRAALTHSFGLALLTVSAVTALLIAALATDAANRALWVFLWGLVAYAATAAVLVATRPRTDEGSPAASPDAVTDDLVRLTEESLRHLNDHGALAASQLIHSIPRTLQAAIELSGDSARREATPLEQARVLHEVLLGAIQRLKPAGDDDTASREALEYRVLYEEYVLRRPNSSIMTRLSVSDRTFFRYRRTGVAAIARELRTQEQLLAAGTSRAEVADGPLSLPGGTVTVLFLDIVDSTGLTEHLGDAAYRAKTRDLDGTLREQIRDCGGVPVAGKVLGDGVMAVFTAARDAIDCALHCRDASEAVGIQLHLGLHAGDVLSEGDNVYGGTVNLAARISAASDPGEVLVSQTVRALARTSAGVKFEDRGEHALKGIDEPQRLFRVQSA